MTPATIFSTQPGRHYGGLAIARTLGRLGVEVSWIHPLDRKAALSSRFVGRVVPVRIGCDIDETLDTLATAAGSIGTRSVLIPVDDAAAVIVAEHEDRLRDHFIFPRQQPALARALSDKRAMHDLCRAHGVRTPTVAVPGSLAEVESFATTTTYPVVVKKISNSDSDGIERPNVVVVADAAALIREYAQQDWNVATNALIQEYVPGGPETIWMFDGYFDATSTMQFGIIGRKLRQAPPYTGVTTLGVCEEHDELLDDTARFLSAIGYAGPVDLGYRWDARDDSYKMLDINPRVGATFRLFADATGHDVVRSMYFDLTGHPVRQGKALPGRRWLLEPNDAMSSFRYYRDGVLTFTEWRRSLRGVDEFAWWASDDRRPLVTLVADSVRLRIAAVARRLTRYLRRSRA